MEARLKTPVHYLYAKTQHMNLTKYVLSKPEGIVQDFFNGCIVNALLPLHIVHSFINKNYPLENNFCAPNLYEQ